MKNKLHEIFDDIEVVLEHLRNDLTGCSLPEEVLGAMDRVETWLATMSEDDEKRL